MEYIEAIRRHWLAALLTVITVLVPTAAVNLLSPAQYTATTQLWMGVSGGKDIVDLNQKVSTASDLMSTYPELVRSPLVLDPVIERLELPTDAAELAERLTATVPNDSLVLEITVTDDSAVRAADTSNAVADQFSTVVASLPQVSTGSTMTVQTTVMQRALPPAHQSSPQVLRNLGIAAALSAVLAIIVCLLLTRFGQTAGPKDGPRDHITQPSSSAG